MRKLLLKCFVAMMLALPALVPASAYAQGVDVLDPVCQSADPNDRPDVCDNNLSGQNADNPILGQNGILNRVINILSLIVGIACVIVIIISGLRFIVSAGDSNAISSARRSLLYAIIGLIIVALSRIIVSFVLSKLE